MLCQWESCWRFSAVYFLLLCVAGILVSHSVSWGQLVWNIFAAAFLRHSWCELWYLEEFLFIMKEVKSKPAAQHDARRHASSIAHFIYYSLNSTHDVTGKYCVFVGLASDLIKNISLLWFLASPIDILWPFTAHKNSFYTCFKLYLRRGRNCKSLLIAFWFPFYFSLST